jgi:lipopolysaccharide/colanic/teichoic acid biosynthesis glycosyltransferase
MSERLLDQSSIERISRITGHGSNRTLLQETVFRNALSGEVLRSERSGNFLLLALLHYDCSEWSDRYGRLTRAISESLGLVIRSTDLIGWYNQNKTMGLLLTDLREPAKGALRESIDSKLQTAVSAAVTAESGPRLRVTYHVFPDVDCASGLHDPVLAPECVPDPGTVAGAVKRCLDIACSSLLLVAFLPLFAAIALAIKVTSEGPVFYPQTRIGQGGRTFTLFKFRSMFRDSDDSQHRDYVTRMIAGTQVPQGREPGAAVYKIVNDPRVTPLGKILRRSSLDELPQLLNVLRGEMSLVGPRPPLPYEFACYRDWHKRRVLEVKPGLTGLWQVCGRCRTTFEDMVRLDLRYARQWSLWLDLKILFQTPAAVILGHGAY